MNLKKIKGKNLALGYVGYRALDALMGPISETIRLCTWAIIILFFALALRILERL
jgi:hypothetical protein